MTLSEFEVIAKLTNTRGRSKTAAKLFFIDGMRKAHAAQEAGIARQTLHKKVAAMQKFEKTVLIAFNRK